MMTPSGSEALGTSKMNFFGMGGTQYTTVNPVTGLYGAYTIPNGDMVREKSDQRYGIKVSFGDEGFSISSGATGDSSSIAIFGASDIAKELFGLSSAELAKDGNNVSVALTPARGISSEPAVLVGNTIGVNLNNKFRVDTTNNTFVVSVDNVSGSVQVPAKDDYTIYSFAAELERRSATLKAAQATLDQALAQAQSQSNQAAYAKLTAPTAGVITGIEAEPGQVVSAGQAVVRFAQEGPRDAVFAVPEHVVSRLKLGQKMTATLSNGQQTLSGQVREIGASADPATRTFTVKLGLVKAEILPLGITLNVHAPQLAGSQSNVIKVPTSALRQEGQQSAVWVFDPASSTVSSQAVQVATADGNEVVIASGLKAGQQIVSAGVHVLSPGQKVTVYKSEVTPAPESK